MARRRLLTRALVETLRAVASQVEADPALAARLMAGPAIKAEYEAPAQTPSRLAREVVAPPLDPFTVLRQWASRDYRRRWRRWISRR